MRSSTIVKEELLLRQFFDDVCRTSGASAQHVAFAEAVSLFA